MSDPKDAGGAGAPGPAWQRPVRPARPVDPPVRSRRSGSRRVVPPVPDRPAPVPVPLGGTGRHVLPSGTSHPRRGRRVARALSWIAVVTSVAVLASAGAGWALLNRYDGNIDRISGALGLPGVDRPEDPDDGARTILIVGSDSRGDLAPGEGSQGVGDEFVVGQRADTILLAHLFGGSDQAQIVSIPRDSYVEIPAFHDPDTGRTTPAHQGKVNSALHEGGPALLVSTLELLTDVRIDHYVQIDFDGFRSMVDELGGIEVCLSEPAEDPYSGIDLPAGRQVVEGQQALAFVRQRHGLPRGDLDRIARQQQFMGAVIRKTLSAGTLLNPLKLNGFLEAATASLEVDEDLTMGDLRDLALRMRGADAGGVVFTTIPTSDTAARRGGESVVLIDEPAAEALFSRIRRDIPPDAPDPGQQDQEPLVVAPESIRVAVFNGAGINGLGRKAATDLEEVGFVVAGVPQDRGSGATSTVVHHGPDRADSARTLAAAIPGATTQLDPDLDRVLEVVVGSDYTGAQPVTVGEAPVPGPAPSQEPVLTAADDVCSL